MKRPFKPARLLAAALLAAAAMAAADPAETPVQVLARAEVLLDQGERDRAVELLRPLLDDLAHSGDAAAQALASTLLGRAYLRMGQTEAAQPLIEHAAELARGVPLPQLAAGILNDLGLLHAALHDEDAALADYAEGLKAALAARQPELGVSLSLNAADLQMRRGAQPAAEELLRQAAQVLPQAPASAARDRLAAGLATRLLALEAVSPNAQRRALLRVLLADALAQSTSLGDLRGKSLVLGASAELDRQAGALDPALDELRQAALSAQAVQAPDLLYRWEWQAGRLQAAQGRIDLAAASYRRAIAALEPIRHDLLLELRGTGDSYRDAIGPLFTEFADLLLKRSAQAADGEAAQPDLLEARDTIEQLKTVELEDYFKDDCVARFRGRRHDADPLAAAGAAVIYPVILPDRLELLVGIGRHISRYTVPVSGKTLADAALVFRKLVVRRASEQYLPQAQQLYAWLVRPELAELQARGVDTLVVVPDGALLGVPFAALHDGQDFLVRHYAVATTPALRLIESGASAPGDRALLGGLSVAVQGYPALPAVEGELHDVSRLYHAQLLDNQHFTVPLLQQAADRGRFSLLHIASHGRFEANAADSFLLTYDGKMGMDTLERVVGAGRNHGDPLDLLTLSACETAAGDERAALGLAGVAVKAGARSVLATLWLIDDEASSVLIADFYRELAQGGRGKAKALQAAQLQLLADSRYAHPGYWAPFLLIGNWN